MTNNPVTEEAVGTYLLSGIYLESVEKGLSEKIRNMQKNSSRSSITLRSDGTATLLNFPCFGTASKIYRGIRNLDVKWKIRQNRIEFIHPNSNTLIPHSAFSGTDKVDGIIFAIYNGDFEEILYFSK
jgi:hypothetical protein